VRVWGPAVPPGPVAVIEKVVVDANAILALPEVGSGPESSGWGTSGVMVTEVASVVAQVIVVLWPPPMMVGEAVNWVICGGAGGATVTVTVCGLLLPPFPVATAE